jgi:hypothetical protein
MNMQAPIASGGGDDVAVRFLALILPERGSPAIWTEVPIPPDAMLSLSGLALA